MYHTTIYLWVSCAANSMQVARATDIPETVNLKGGSYKPLAKPPKPTEFHLKVTTFTDEW